MLDLKLIDKNTKVVEFKSFYCAREDFEVERLDEHKFIVTMESSQMKQQAYYGFAHGPHINYGASQSKDTHKFIVNELDFVEYEEFPEWWNRTFQEAYDMSKSEYERKEKEENETT